MCGALYACPDIIHSLRSYFKGEYVWEAGDAAILSSDRQDEGEESDGTETQDAMLYSVRESVPVAKRRSSNPDRPETAVGRGSQATATACCSVITAYTASPLQKY